MFMEVGQFMSFELRTIEVPDNHLNFQRISKIYDFSDRKTDMQPLGGFQVVSALDYLHTKLSVIHRDVKPSNILVSRGFEPRTILKFWIITLNSAFLSIRQFCCNLEKVTNFGPLVGFSSENGQETQLKVRLMEQHTLKM